MNTGRAVLEYGVRRITAFNTFPSRLAWQNTHLPADGRAP